MPSDPQTTISSLVPKQEPLRLDDVLEALSVVRRPDGVLVRRVVTIEDIVRLVADELERRRHD